MSVTELVTVVCVCDCDSMAEVVVRENKTSTNSNLWRLSSQNDVRLLFHLSVLALFLLI